MFENQRYDNSTFSKDVNKLLTNPLIKRALDHGGFIAGGLGRQIFNKRSLRRYFREGKGDIDIFFNDSAAYSIMREWVLKQQFPHNISWNNSITGYCTDIYLPIHDLLNSKDSRSVKLQLVNIFHGTPEDVMSTFDLENCKVALTKDRIIYSRAVPRLELLETLKIVHSNSPLLAGRILKYRYLRKLTQYHPESSEHIGEWLIRWRLNKWDEHPFASDENKFKWNTQTNDFIRMLIKYPEIVHDDHLSILLGKLNYRVNVGGGYYPKWETKCAVLEELSHRKIQA
jgi:hypothetical protein